MFSLLTIKSLIFKHFNEKCGHMIINGILCYGYIFD